MADSESVGAIYDRRESAKDLDKCEQLQVKQKVLDMSVSKEKCTPTTVEPKVSGCDPVNNEKEEDMLKTAALAILKETKRAKMRANEFGPSGWLSNPSGRPNKRFLSNVLVQTEQSNTRNKRIKTTSQVKSKRPSQQ